MKHLIAIVFFVFIAASVTPSIAANSGEKKATKSATHKHKDMKEGCCDMKGADSSKKSDCCKMDSKKESSKTEKEEKKKLIEERQRQRRRYFFIMEDDANEDFGMTGDGQLIFEGGEKDGKENIH